MGGILSGLRVLDLTSGIAGPLTGMLLADHGAGVIRVERPGGDPLRDIGRCRLGYRTWNRGKRSIELDLKDADDLDVFMALVDHADILIESHAIGTAAAAVATPPITQIVSVWESANPISLNCQISAPPAISQRPSVMAGTPSETAVVTTGSSRQGYRQTPSEARTGWRAGEGLLLA